MDNIEISKNLASYAIYKELYDSSKDTYDIISEFIKSSLKLRKKYSFTAQDIAHFLKDDFDFEIPESIIRTVLKRLNITKSNGTYTLEYTFDEALIVENKQKDILENNQHIISSLYLYIEQKTKKTLTEKSKQNISQAFSSFLLNENGIDNEFYEDISSYIIANKHDLNFKKQLNLIKEGVILYSGIRYGEITQKRKQLSNELIIYLDTEILFHLAGYNGKLFKDLFDDFYKLVKEFNSVKKKILFKYFKTTEDEINNFFKKAEYLLDKPTKIDPSKTAMNNIIEGCSSKSDIVSKKTKFFQLLETYNIMLDSTETFLTENATNYNLINKDLIENLSNNYEEYEISNSLDKLNSISILRGKKYNNNFNDIGYILLSGNAKIFKIAWNKYLKTQGEVPLVTHLDFLINKFWLKLNKGFGNTALPKTFDVITKAQIVLSNTINNNISEKYNRLKEEVKQGKLNKDEILDTIINLKSEVKQPEEIDEDTLPNILDALSFKDIEKYKHEKEQFKQKARKDEEENVKLKNDIDSIKKLTESQKKELLIEKQEKVEALLKLKKIADNKFNNKINIYKFIWIISIIVYYIVFFILIKKLGWNDMEQWTWIFGIVFPIIISFVYTITNEKSFNILHHLSNKREYYKQQSYQEFDLNIKKLSELEKDIQYIQQNLAPNRYTYR